MNSSRTSYSLTFLTFILIFSTATTALNITKILGNYPELSNFNDYLTKTQLADQINKRQTITILAVDNGAVSHLSGKPSEIIKKILSVHVILDYFDIKKLTGLSQDKSTLLATLFQASGAALNQQGFLKVALVNDGEITFGSAVKHVGEDAKLVQSIVARPYNISVLQITSIITVPGIDSSSPAPSSNSPLVAPAKAPASKAPTPSKKPIVEAPTPAEEGELEGQVAEAPVGAAEAPVDVAKEPIAEEAVPVTSPPIIEKDVGEAPSTPRSSSSALRPQMTSSIACIGVVIMGFVLGLGSL